MPIFKFLADKDQKPIRIDKFLIQAIPNISRNQIQKSTRLGKISVNERIIKKNNYKIKPLDSIIIETIPTSIFFLDEEYKNIIEEKIPLDILHEDKDVLVVNKPAGMVVHPGFGHEKGTLIHGIKYHLKKNSNQNRFPPRLGLIHRIDKDTSGLLLLAKNEHSQKWLLQQFFHKTIKRKYIALVWGDLQKKEGSITGFIGRDPKNRKRMILFQNPFPYKGKYSITHYKILERYPNITYISCNIETGKTHQIRAHFKYLGHPLFNDSTYGGDQILMKKKLSKKNIEFFNMCLKILKRQALHAISLSFIHPRNKRKYNFTCPIPEDFKNVLLKCRDKF
ncbi:RluA family pseudouridine synthase [Blattabacterium cuenoti]|uniref:RluA family pseudouridine synthase n=1 Tax=Blattabacterium cuenoti TaxID=1653831 RepID=UPI00163D0712|nr:RluA family pseudouridine synthase [Blattabacterium cuenoti]